MIREMLDLMYRVTICLRCSILNSNIVELLPLVVNVRALLLQLLSENREEVVGSSSAASTKGILRSGSILQAMEFGLGRESGSGHVIWECEGELCSA